MENQPFTAVSMNSGVFMLICCREASSIFIYLFIYLIVFFCVCVYIFLYVYIYICCCCRRRKEFFFFTYVEGSLLKRLRREVEKLVEFILEFSKVASYILLVGVTIVIYVLGLCYLR